MTNATLEALSSSDPNLERLAAYRADVIVVSAFVLDYVGREALAGLGGEVVDVPDDPAERLLLLGDTFGVRPKAQSLIDDLEAAIAEARTTLKPDGRAVSVATVYPGPSVAAWVDGPIEVPATLLAIGYTLQPAADEVEGEEGGRVYLSNEQIGLLDADTLVAMQSDLVEGEPEAIEAIAEDPLWARLPAVAGDRVITVDRLGYPGIAGRLRLVEDLVARLA